MTASSSHHHCPFKYTRWQAVTKVSRVKLVRATLLLLLSAFPGVLGENAGFNPAVLGLLARVFTIRSP